MKNNRATIISIVIAVILIGGALLYAMAVSSSKSTAVPSGVAQAGNNTPSAGALPISNNEPYIGSASAPLTLYYWHDFQCPFCGKFDTETLPSLVTEYVNTGKLRIVFKDFVFLGPNSETAAELSRAVWASASSSYNTWQEAIFSHQGAEGSDWASEANLLALTRTVPGINASSVLALMNENSSTYQTAINADYSEGQRFGISATPGFWLEGQSFSGAQPLAFFEQIINADLTK